MTAPFAPPAPGSGEPLRPIRLMLVDDSAVARAIFQRMLAPRPEFEVAATAPHVAGALEQLDTTRVDTILLDVEMPGIDGLTALPRLIERSGGARIMIVSSAADISVRALTLGAADVLAKPGAGRFAGRFADTLAEKLLRIGHAPPRPAAGTVTAAIVPPPPARPARPVRLRPPVAGPVDCIAIGASTGGLHALSAFFRALPASVTVPLLVTQHLPASFMPYFAAQMRDIAGRPARVAQDGERLEAGTILIAPGDAHLTPVPARGGPRVVLDRTPAPSGCLPSVDPMLDAVAALYGAGAVGVVLTGMGRDGAAAAPRLADAGGEVLVQDIDSAVIWGMPGSVAMAGAAAAMLPPGEIAQRIARRIAAAPARQEGAAWR